jgi:beta-apo-4'-carotenal oxygenase
MKVRVLSLEYSGGINPCIITENTEIKLAAKRIAWGKAHNCGQICLSPDYVLVHRSLESAFVKSYIASMKTFFPNGAKEPGAMTRIVNNRHFLRIKGLVDKSEGTIVYGGEMDEAENYIAPTLVKINSTDDSLLSEEIFGPVLPFLVVDSTDEMIRITNQVSDTPLALYAFTYDKDEEERSERPKILA